MCLRISDSFYPFVLFPPFPAVLRVCRSFSISSTLLPFCLCFFPRIFFSFSFFSWLGFFFLFRYAFHAPLSALHSLVSRRVAPSLLLLPSLCSSSFPSMYAFDVISFSPQCRYLHHVRFCFGFAHFCPCVAMCLRVFTMSRMQTHCLFSSLLFSSPICAASYFLRNSRDKKLDGSRDAVALLISPPFKAFASSEYKGSVENLKARRC